jgi:hypothetical protein
VTTGKVPPTEVWIEGVQWMTVQLSEQCECSDSYHPIDLIALLTSCLGVWGHVCHVGLWHRRPAFIPV